MVPSQNYSTDSPKGNNDDFSLPRSHAENIHHQPVKPSRLGQNSLGDWTAMYSGHDLAAKEFDGADGVKLGNQRVKVGHQADCTPSGLKQDLLSLQSTCRNYI